MRLTTFLNYWSELNWLAHFRHLVGCLAIAALLVIVAPFGTGDQPGLFRLLYWFCMLWIFGAGVLPVVARRLRTRRHLLELGLSVGVVVTVAIATIPMAAIVQGTDWLVWWIFTSFASASAQAVAPPSLALIDSLGIYAKVFAIALLGTGLNSLLILHLTGPVPSAAPAVVPGLKFLSRLPGQLGNRLLYLQMEDHYLRATTANGCALILIRFRDALGELDGVAGLQVHRSWWVSIDAIANVSRDGRKLEITTIDGTRIPVSAAHRQTVLDRLGLPADSRKPST